MLFKILLLTSFWSIIIMVGVYLTIFYFNQFIHQKKNYIIAQIFPNLLLFFKGNVKLEIKLINSPKTCHNNPKNWWYFQQD